MVIMTDSQFCLVHSKKKSLIHTDVLTRLHCGFESGKRGQAETIFNHVLCLQLTLQIKNLEKYVQKFFLPLSHS